MRVETEYAWLLLSSFESILDKLGKIYSKEELEAKGLEINKKELIECLEKIDELDRVLQPNSAAGLAKR